MDSEKLMDTYSNPGLPKTPHELEAGNFNLHLSLRGPEEDLYKVLPVRIQEVRLGRFGAKIAFEALSDTGQPMCEADWTFSSNGHLIRKMSGEPVFAIEGQSGVLPIREAFFRDPPTEQSL